MPLEALIQSRIVPPLSVERETALFKKVPWHSRFGRYRAVDHKRWPNLLIRKQVGIRDMRCAWHPEFNNGSVEKSHQRRSRHFFVLTY